MSVWEKRSHASRITDPDALIEEASRPVEDAELQEHVYQILGHLGEDPHREGLVRTPERVAHSLRSLTCGYGVSVQDVVGDAVFEEEHESMVLVRDIEVYSLCEHHMLPFFGR
ncbi:MAG: GTP cyclohydrolase I, partial [Gemmatimonadetes bacterium]|nr:GTP cyclohydrolase I [Gemmatimonadota bacterium]